MRDLLATIALSLPAAIIFASLPIHERASRPRMEVIDSTPQQVAAQPAGTASASMSDARTADVHDAPNSSAVLHALPAPVAASAIDRPGNAPYIHAPPSSPVPAEPAPTPVSSLGPSHPPSLGQYPPRLMQCGPSGCALELARASSKPYQFARRRVFGGGFFRRRR